jgi:hypothetical protein
MKLYMHTIDGRPAEYWPGEQITFARYRNGVSHFAESIQQIRKEERASLRYRRSRGWHDRCAYGYVVLRITQEGTSSNG